MPVGTPPRMATPDGTEEEPAVVESEEVSEEVDKLTSIGRDLYGRGADQNVCLIVWVCGSYAETC